MLAAIDHIAGRGGRFLVFGRRSRREAPAEANETPSVDDFQTAALLVLPPELLALCTEVPESAFRADISSTQLRRQQTNLDG